MNQKKKTQPKPPDEKRGTTQAPLPDPIIYLENRILMLEDMKDRIAETVFQTISLFITVLALIVAIPLAIITRFEFNDSLKLSLILVVLIGILGTQIIWVWSWIKYRKKIKEGKTNETTTN